MSTIKIKMDKIYPLNKTTLKENCPLSQPCFTYSTYIDLLNLHKFDEFVYLDVRNMSGLSEICPKKSDNWWYKLYLSFERKMHNLQRLQCLHKCASFMQMSRYGLKWCAKWRVFWIVYFIAD